MPRVQAEHGMVYVIIMMIVMMMMMMMMMPRLSTVYDDVTSVCVPRLPRCSAHSDCDSAHMCCRHTCCPKLYWQQWTQFR